MHCKQFKSYPLLIIAILFILMIITQNQQIPSQVEDCIEYRKGTCMRCPWNTHLKQGQCYQNIYGCINYQYFSQYSICRQCNLTISVPNNKSNCQRLSSLQNTQNTSSQLINLINIELKDDQIFKQLVIKNLANDIWFQKCNNFMRTGQYRHFISRSVEPVFSVFSFSSKGFKQYKILYEGSGGNMLMCLIAISQDTKTIVLRSFVTIGRTQIVIGCVDYSIKLDCTRCKQGFHMNVNAFGEKICNPNIPGCISYFGNICTQCRGFHLLIENRCISSCLYFNDTRSLKFYGNWMALKGAALNYISRQYPRI